MMSGTTGKKFGQVAKNLVEDLCSSFERKEDQDVLIELRRNHCNKPFQPETAETDTILCEIWKAAFPHQYIGTSESDPKWRQLGFQSDKPRSDIRAGEFALVQLHYLARRYPLKLQRLVCEAKDLDYPFACSCFNVSHMVALFFGLYDRPAMNPVPSARQASQRQRNHFAKLCRTSYLAAHNVLNELFCALVEQLHETWKLMCGFQGGNLMDFPKALVHVYEFHADFWRRSHDSIADFCELERNANLCSCKSLASTRFDLTAALICEDLFRALRRQLIHAARGIVTVLTGPSLLPQLFDQNNASGEIGLASDAGCTKYSEYKPPCLVVSTEATCVTAARKSWFAKPVAFEDSSEINAFFDNMESSLSAPMNSGMIDEVLRAKKEAELENPTQFENLDAFLDHCLAVPSESKPPVVKAQGSDWTMSFS